MAVGSGVMWLGLPIGLTPANVNCARWGSGGVGRGGRNRRTPTQPEVRARPTNDEKASDRPRRITPVYVIVIGIDPGVAHTGYGVVAQRRGRIVALDGGVIQTVPGRDLGGRLAVIHERVGALIDAYRPDALALEQVYFGTNAHSAFAVGQARGVVMLAAGQRGVPCASYTPQQVKGAVCGSGRAPKDQVQRMVQTLLSLPDLPRPDHAADALAVAICHANGAPLAAARAAG
jgi:crossover junction endodeoxyribonuclease RuvC